MKSQVKSPVQPQVVKVNHQYKATNPIEETTTNGLKTSKTHPKTPSRTFQNIQQFTKKHILFKHVFLSMQNLKSFTNAIFL